MSYLSVKMFYYPAWQFRLKADERWAIETIMVGRFITRQTKTRPLKSSAADPVRGRRSGRSRSTGLVDVAIHADADTVFEVRSLPIQD